MPVSIFVRERVDSSRNGSTVWSGECVDEDTERRWADAELASRAA